MGKKDQKSMTRFRQIGKATWIGVKWLSYNLGWVSGSLTAIMMIIIMREVVGRYIFNNPSEWSLELSCYLLVGLVYLGAAHTEIVGKQLRIDFIYSRYSGKTKNVANIFIYVIGLSWCSVLVWQGGSLAWHSLLTGARSAEVMMWPLFPSQVLVPIGSLLVCLVFLGRIVREIKLLLGEK